MGLLKTAFLISIFWCQTQTAPLTEKECPNEFSYILGDKCYSLHTLHFYYNSAVDYCKNHNGTLWSKTNEEEVDFIRKVNVKLSYQYWVGAREEGLQWKYLSDNSLVSQSLIKKPGQKKNYCLALQYTKQTLTPISCLHNLCAICEYTDAKCEKKKNEGNECFEFTVNEENFTDATKICESIGGRIVEIRDEAQLAKLKKAIRQDKAFENIRKDKLNKFDGSFPILWHLNQDDDNLCEIYQNWEIQTADCSAIHNFACKFDAIPKTPEITVVNAHTTQHSTEGDLPGEKPTIFKDPDDVPKDSTTTTTLIIIMGILIVILVIAVAFLLYCRYRARNRGNGEQGEEQEALQPA